MQIQVNKTITLDLINESHALSIFEMVELNRLYLRQWLSFVDKMDSLLFAENFVKGTIKRNLDGLEFAFVIVENGKVIGRIGVYKIDQQNKIGEIGYWLVEHAQGKGIIHASCKALIHFCFSELSLNRIEIKCATENYKSQSIPHKLGFQKEGVLREGEWLYDKFVDLMLFSLLKSEMI